LELPEKIVQISSGNNHHLLLSSSGIVYSYGSGAEGKLGHGLDIRYIDLKVPTEIKSTCLFLFDKF